MPNQITIEEALKLVSFERCPRGLWRVRDVPSYVFGDLDCGAGGNIYGDIHGGVYGNIYGDVGYVYGKINGREWKFAETPKERFHRLITESGDPELIDAFNQLENS